MRKRLLIMELLPSSLPYKLLYFLKDYFDITLISLTSKEKYSEERYKKLGIKVHSFNFQGERYWKDKKFFSFFKETINFIFKFLKIKRKKFDFVLGVTAPNYVGYFLFKMFKKSKKIYFPYDIKFFMLGKQKRSKIDVISEKYCFKNADFIIAKGEKNQLNLITKNEVERIKGKSIRFLPYCFDEWIVPIKKKKDKLKGIHLVYIGSFDNYSPTFKIQYPELYKIFSKQGISVHLYPTTPVNENLKNLVQIHKPLPNLDLNNELGKYHYGINITFHKEKLLDKRWIKTCVSNTIFSYLEAGIPVIVNEEIEFMASIIKKYSCGVVISEKDLPNLKKILEKQNYSKLLKGVEKARKDLNMGKEIKRIVNELNINHYDNN